MPTITKARVSVEKFGLVSSDSFEPWTEKELYDRAMALEIERRTMPTITNATYRANSGASALLITPNDGMSWDDLFNEYLLPNPRNFIGLTTDEFDGEDEENGEIRTPGVQTIIKSIQREAYRRGIVVGTQNVQAVNDDGVAVTHTNDKGEDVPTFSLTDFRVCFRPNVTKLPKWFYKLLNDGVKQDLVESSEEE